MIVFIEVSPHHLCYSQMNSCHGRSICQYTFSPAGLPWWFSDKESTCQCRRYRRCQLGRFSGGGHGNPFTCSCLGTPMNRGAWWATVRGAAKSRVRVSTCIHSCFVFLTCVYSLIRNGFLRIIKSLEKRRVSDLFFSPIHPLRLRTSSTKAFQIILILTSLL